MPGPWDSALIFRRGGFTNGFLRIHDMGEIIQDSVGMIEDNSVMMNRPCIVM